MILGCKQNQQQIKILTLGKYCALDIETKVQEIQEEDALWTDFVYEEEGKDVELKNLGAEQSKKATSKVEEIKEEALVSPQAQDPLEEVNLGEGSVQQPTYVSTCLNAPDRNQLLVVLKKYKDCFAWSYNELPGLDRSLVEHRLHMKPNFKPYKQKPRRMSPEVIQKVNEEILRLLKAGFIRTIRYVEWLSNIVPVVKKNGKMRVCIAFRNLNLATPKDEYPMPIVDLLVDSSAGHKILSMMDGHRVLIFWSC